MKAVILVGGEGMRLRPLTCNLPKPMVPIANRPFLEYTLEYLNRHGIEEVILAVSYLPHRIQSYFGKGEKSGLKLTYVVEESPLGTAGAVKNVARYLKEPFFVLNGDIFTDIDLSEMAAFHRKNKAMATIALLPVEDISSYGVVECDKKQKVLRFLEKPSRDAVTANTINAGIYFLEPQVLEHIPAQSFFTFEQGLFPLLAQKGEGLYGFAARGYWIDIGTPEKYLSLHYDLLLGKARQLSPNQEVLWGDGCQVHPTAQVRGPVVIGKNCVIGPRVQITGPTVLGDKCEIQAGAVVERSVLWEGVHLGAGTIVKNCVISSRCYIGQECLVPEGCVLGEEAVLEAKRELPQGTRVWAGERLEAGAPSF